MSARFACSITLFVERLCSLAFPGLLGFCEYLGQYLIRPWLDITYPQSKSSGVSENE